MFKGKQLAFIRGHPTLLRTRSSVTSMGGVGCSCPSTCIDGGGCGELAIVKTVRTEQFNHAPAQLFLHAGFERFGRRASRSWVSYRLGTENRDLPSYVVLIMAAWPALATVFGEWFSTDSASRRGVPNKKRSVCCQPEGHWPGSRRDIVDGINFLNKTALTDVVTKSPRQSRSMSWRTGCGRVYRR